MKMKQLKEVPPLMRRVERSRTKRFVVCPGGPKVAPHVWDKKTKKVVWRGEFFNDGSPSGLISLSLACGYAEENNSVKSTSAPAFMAWAVRKIGQNMPYTIPTIFADVAKSQASAGSEVVCLWIKKAPKRWQPEKM